MKHPKNSKAALIQTAVFLAALFAHSASAQPLAFPSAYGAGAYTTGGRGGEVIHVTTLASSGPGSLREALKTPVPRYIVFDVSGVIHLEGQIYMHPAETGDAGDFTVNGFSAPFGGITITGSAIRTAGGLGNMIWRGIRFRNGYLPSESNGSSNATCFGTRGGDDVVVDRCSFSYARSKGLGAGTSNPGESATRHSFQNNLFGNSQQGMLVGNSDGEEFGDVSVMRNVFSNLGWRHPKVGGAITLDVINNLSHNWQGRTIRMDAWDYRLNLIGNYYQGGTITRVAERDDLRMFTTWTNTTMSPQIWDEDNFIEERHRPEGYPAMPESGWYPFASSTEPVNPAWFVDARLPFQGRAIPILASESLKEELLPRVGACEYIDNDGVVQFYRDAIDTVLVSDAETDADSRYVNSGDYESLANGLADSMPSEMRPSDFYMSNPHIPEVWFSANVPEGEDHNDIAPSGYTWIEEYLNRVDGDSGPVEPMSDAGPGDAGTSDAGTSDSGTFDAGSSDAGMLDAEAFDAGSSDAGMALSDNEGCGCRVSRASPNFAASLLGVSLLLLTLRRRRRR